MNATLAITTRFGYVEARTFASYLGTWGKVSQWCNRLLWTIVILRGRFLDVGKGALK